MDNTYQLKRLITTALDDALKPFSEKIEAMTLEIQSLKAEMKKLKKGE